MTDDILKTYLERYQGGPSDDDLLREYLRRYQGPGRSGRGSGASTYRDSSGRLRAAPGGRGSFDETIARLAGDGDPTSPVDGAPTGQESRQKARPLNLPPTPSMPERPETYADRSRRAPRGGRIADILVGSLSQMVTGHNTYADRLALEEADLMSDYQDDMKRYREKLSRRDRDIKEQMASRPIDKGLAELYGAPEGTPIGVFDRTYRQTPAAQRTLAEEQHGRDVDMLGRKAEVSRESQTQSELQDLAKMQMTAAARLQAAAARAKQSGNGDLSSFLGRFDDDDIDAYIGGSMRKDIRTDLPVALSLAGADKLADNLRQERSKNLTEQRQQKAGFRRAIEQRKSAMEAADRLEDTLAKIRDKHSRGSGPSVDEVVEEIKTADLGTMSPEAAELFTNLQNMASRYVFGDSGKQLTETEKRLSAGRVAVALDPSIIDADDAGIVSRVVGKPIIRRLTKDMLEPEDITRFMDIVRENAASSLEAAAQGPIGPRLLWDEGLRDRSAEKVITEWERENRDTGATLTDPPVVRPAEDDKEWKVLVSKPGQDEPEFETFRLRY